VVALLATLEQTATAANGTDAQQLVREVIRHELEAQANESGDNRLWSYQEHTRRDGKELLLEYCETRYGTIHRLLAVNGQPLDPNQSQAEDKRIRKLIDSPDAVEAAQKKERADAEEEQKFLKLFPEAFHFREMERLGDLVNLTFTPDPNFSPSGMEERVLSCLEGTMAVNVKQERLVSVSGRLATEVKFWGGLAGHLNGGGTFSVRSENVAPGDWELQSLDVEMSGKVLLFKTLTIQEHHTYLRYTRVSPNLSLAQAAEHLQNDSNP